MIDKETAWKMLENRACDGVRCSNCPIDNLQHDEFGYYEWARCCEKNSDGAHIPIKGRKFRPRVIRLLTEWLAEQEAKGTE